MKNVLSFASKYHLAGFLWTLAAVAVTTLALEWVRARLTIEVIALLYLVPVMLSSRRWGLLPAVVASLAAFLAVNYFFLAPTHTLMVSDPRELLALVIFLIVAILISQAVGAANLHAAEARAREMEATTLYNLTKVLSALDVFNAERNYWNILDFNTEHFFNIFRSKKVIAKNFFCFFKGNIF